MPVDNGIIYSDYNPSLNTGRGIGLHEISRVLGVGVQDEATLCCSEKVNGLSRYRPVKWDKPGDLNMQDDIRHSARSYWWEPSAVGTPWIYGQGYDSGYRTIVAPAIDMTFDQLVDANGNMTSAAKWIFNRPTFAEYTHIDMFHGYNHKAKASIFGRVEGGRYNNGDYEISRNKGTLHVGLKAEISNYSGYSYGYYALRKEDGCWAPSELLKIINFPSTAYVGVAIRNRSVTAQTGNRWRYSIGTVGVVRPGNTIGSGANAYKEIDVMQHHTEGNFYFDLFFVNRQNALNAVGPGAKGLYMDVYTGDVLDIVVFLSDKAITSAHSMTAPRITGRSLYINNDYKPVRTFKVVDSTATWHDDDVKYRYEITTELQRPNDYIDFGKTVYYSKGNEIYAFDGVIKNVKFKSDTPALVINMPEYDDYDSGYTLVSVYTSYYLQDGGLFLLPVSNQYVDFKANNGVYRTKWQSTRIEVYTTLSDAVEGNTNTVYLDDFMRDELGMSSAEINNNAGYLPVYFTEAWRIHNNTELAPIMPPQVEKIVVNVSCNPQWDYDSEFLKINYRGKVEYVGLEERRIVWD